jgi:fucose 4-O-acetylase-like acetyltransferase
MPAFIIISGFFAKGIYEKGYIWKLTKKLILPYVLFQVIYGFFYYFLHGKETFKLELLDPKWSLWFLISLFFWNILLLIFNKLKPGTSLAIAVSIGLVAGFADWIANYLSLSRTLVFFPFFLAGYLLNKEHFQMLRTGKAKIAAALIMLAVTIGIICFPDLNEKWFFGSKPYSEFESGHFLGMWKRAGVYAIQFAMAGSFFAFVPGRRFFFTSWGKNTLYVYLLHGFIVRLFRGSSLEEYLNETFTLPILIFASFVLTALLSSKYVTSLTQPFIELRMSKWKQFIGQLRKEYRRPGHSQSYKQS